MTSEPPVQAGRGDSESAQGGPTPNTQGAGEWQYDPASDLDANLSERFRSFPREPHMWMYALRSTAMLALRGWLRLFHQLEIHGREHLPIGSSFVLVANHQSHLDAPCLMASIPLRYRHRVFPAAAADYFFSNLPRSAFSSIFVNAVPFDRRRGGGKSLVICRELLKNPGNILVIFPEGTRSTTGELGSFRPGIGWLLAESEILVVPAHLEGAHRALPKGAILPRPARLRLDFAPPRTYAHIARDREGIEQISVLLHDAVSNLAVAAKIDAP